MSFRLYNERVSAVRDYGIAARRVPPPGRHALGSHPPAGQRSVAIGGLLPRLPRVHRVERDRHTVRAARTRRARPPNRAAPGARHDPSASHRPVRALSLCDSAAHARRLWADSSNTCIEPVCNSASADHLVSEATYLWDPDGLGIEVYADRPRDAWRIQNGRELMMTTDRLDLASVAAAAGGEPWTDAARAPRSATCI